MNMNILNLKLFGIEISKILKYGIRIGKILKNEHEILKLALFEIDYNPNLWNG